MNATQTTAYRVICTRTVGFVDPSITTSVVWEGSDTDQLSRKYPPSEILFADPLGIQEDLEGGFIRTEFVFEHQLTDDAWEKCDDPRRRLTPMTTMELEIDAENRRRFPGDYITECEVCGYEDCRCQDDEGYEQDDPSPDCSNCNDQGCEQCDPETFPPMELCRYCNRWFEVKLLNNDGLCIECQSELEELAKPHCCMCGKVHTDSILQDGDMCESCKEDEARWAAIADAEDVRQYEDYVLYWERHFKWYRRLGRWVLRRQ